MLGASIDADSECKARAWEQSYADVHCTILVCFRALTGLVPCLADHSRSDSDQTSERDYLNRVAVGGAIGEFLGPGTATLTQLESSA